jgi:hypothetical protein
MTQYSPPPQSPEWSFQWKTWINGLYANLKNLLNFVTVSSTGNITLSGTGTRIQGDFSNATISNRTAFQSSTTNGNTIVEVLPNGASTLSGISVNNAVDPTNASTGQLYVNGSTAVILTSNVNGSGTYLPLQFRTGGAERLRIDTSGNVLVTNPAGLGYGTGSGGTVTQATSKSTGVTLNKPTGKIQMNGDALAANTTVEFVLTNSVIATYDLVVLNVMDNATHGAYNVWAEYARAGVVSIYVRNITAGSLSEAIILNFAVIKGTTA